MLSYPVFHHPASYFPTYAQHLEMCLIHLFGSFLIRYNSREFSYEIEEMGDFLLRKKGQSIIVLMGCVLHTYETLRVEEEAHEHVGH
jgi:hypothetical protein